MNASIALKPNAKFFGCVFFATLAGLSPFADGELRAQKKAEQPDFRFSTAAKSLPMQSGGSVAVPLRVLVPADNHVYVKHASDLSMSILTEFSTDTAGWAVTTAVAPAGEKLHEDYVLSGTGQYALDLFETQGRAPGPRIYAVNIIMNTQMCNTKTNVCYRPTKITKQLKVRIAHAKKIRSTAATESQARGGVAWVQNHAQALNLARSSGRNILVVITAPSWCGYCRQLEAQVFSKDAVAQTLNNKFVPLQILDTNNDRNKYNFDGYPTMFVAAATDGKKIAEVYGRDEASFLAAIKQYEINNAGPGTENSDESFVFSVRIDGTFRKTANGWERQTTDDPPEKFSEHRRTAAYVILKSAQTGEFVAIPLKGGKGLAYRNNQWVPAFDAKAQ